jgi:hypothetical protein
MNTCRRCRYIDTKMMFTYKSIDTVNMYRCISQGTETKLTSVNDTCEDFNGDGVCYGCAFKGKKITVNINKCPTIFYECTHFEQYFIFDHACCEHRKQSYGVDVKPMVCKDEVEDDEDDYCNRH